ncbi:MAG TPA: GNAT family N-acetyltransferase [Aliidongia sp.]|nr:GNAT family N-acetyltransferase [Aliidongia sp.]
MTGIEIRRLGPGDEEAVERFLARHAESSLFLRSNLARSGLEDGETAYRGHWAAGRRHGEIIGLASHFWNGNLLLQAPEATVEIAAAALREGRNLAGLIGPWAQCTAVRAALAPDRALRADLRDMLFALDLAALRLPAALNGSACRRAGPADLDRLLDWTAAYGIEALDEADDDRTRAANRTNVGLMIAEGRQFILERDGTPIASCTFNAAIPDMVQVGAVWTPPPLRCRGHARRVVAGALQIARAEGARSAILFTGDDNIPAQRAYRALGFEEIGDYGLIFFQ